VRRLALLRGVAGASLLWASAAAGGYVVAWTLRSHEAASSVLRAGGSRLSSERAFDTSTSCRSGNPRPGNLAGLLEIPRLSLKAPVEQGESDAVLSAAVGHDESSVWPGSDGTSVLAAHDVSWFARIGTLRPGDKVVYVSSCRTDTFVVTGHRIVRRGAPVANSKGPTLVLDTCWPNNALWWTPDRELVMAREVSSKKTAVAASKLTGSASPVRSAPISVPAPPALVAQGLTLDQNPTLLGTMTLGKSASLALVQSPAPLDAEEAALTAYYGTLHALSSDNRAWFADLAPGVAFPAGLAGGHIAGYETRLEVHLTAEGTKLTSSLLSATVSYVTGEGRVEQLKIAVAARIAAGQLTVTSWRAA
jgi:sortase A